jgi:hypothetical protein
MLVRGLGFGMVLVPLQAATYATVTPAQTGRATAVYNATSQFASSLGVAVAASLLTSRLAHHGAQLGNPTTRPGALDAFQDSFVVLGLIAIASIAVAFFISDREAAPTMNTRIDPVTADGAEAAAILGGH